MSRRAKQRQSPLILLVFLVVVLLACRSITVNNTALTPAPIVLTQQIGFDFSQQIPSAPKGDTSARRHLFLHEYPMPAHGFITGITYLNDSDKAVETFDLLILRPNEDGWKVTYRISLSDDMPATQTGTTVVNLPSPWSVQKNDIFAHWQNIANGAIPLNVDNETLEGVSVGQYGFPPSTVEVGEQIGIDGFSGQRDYFINVVFSTNP